MADSTASPEDTEPNSQPPGPVNPISQSNHPDPSPPLSSSSSTPPTTVVAADPNPNPNPNSTTPPPPFVSLPQPPSIQPYAPVQVSSVPPSAPSFRPAAPPVPFHTAPQFSPLPNSNFQAHSFQNPGVQPPGVGPVPVMMPPAASGVGLGSVAISSAPPIMSPYAPPGQPPNPAMRPYAPMPNGYPTMPAPPPGIIRYPSPYASMVRPAFPPRPLGSVGFIPALSRPPVPGIRGPIILPVMRPAVIPSVTPTEKPQTTVYIGKIASSVENDFMLSLLQLCGPVKSWKRVQGPTSGALKGFGFCEFDSAEGVLRALRLLSKLNIDGQELMLNVNQATREYLERYVEKKKENSRNLKATETDGAEKEEGSASVAEKDEPPQPSVEDSKEDNKDIANKESHDLVNFGLVTDEDKEADREGLEKLTGMIEERLKAKPLPPPPPPPTADGPGNSNLELPARSRDGDSDVDIMRQDAAEDKNDDEMTSESKPLSEQDKPETSSPDRSRRNDRRSRDRERDMKREKERELERYEREREQERAKREREREYKIREDERRYRARVKEWESREREREHSRKLEKEREKEREQERKWEIIDQERDSDDGYTKKRKYKSSGEDRKRRFREKEEDLADRLKEEEEIAEAKKRAEEELLQQKEQEKDTVKILSGHATNESDKALFTDETNVEIQDKDDDQTSDGDSGRGNNTGDGILQNGISDESVVESATSDTRQSSNAPTRKLGFGLVGSGKRTTVPSVFHEEEDEDAQKDKKMRPLVPIDYSTEELQAVRDTISGAPSPNLVAAAEFAKRIANVNPREDRPEAERERSRRPHERYIHRDRDHHRNDEATYRTKDESRTETVDRDKDRERGLDKVKTQDNRKLLDAKQLIDTIPKTKDELFSYEINWAIYDKNELHEKMRPWISKKITEFLGEEETTLVNYIVSSTQEHVKAPEMLERLQAILDDEAEMFVLKMWRMLIFEIKRVETGLASRSKT